MLITPASDADAPSPVTATTRRRRKEARPLELLDAALDLFVERGYAVTRAEDVATRAGVSKGTLYLYYPSKEALLEAVIRRHVTNRIAEGRQVLREFEGGTSELLKTMLHLWWARIGETPASGILKLMTAEVRNFPEVAQFYVDEVVAPSNEMLVQVIQRGVDRGEFRPVDVNQVVHALIGPLVFLALHRHALGACSVAFTVEPRIVIDTLLDMVLTGLIPRAAVANAPCST